MSAADLGLNDERAMHSDTNLGAEHARDGRLVAVEWLMVTRSDPGGSVPRFLIEKGTPPGIVGDAGKFLKWTTAKSRRGWEESETAAEAQTPTGETNQAASGASTDALQTRTHNTNPSKGAISDYDVEEEPIPSSNGLYGIVTGIFGVASSVVANGLGLNYASSEESVSTVPAINVQGQEGEDAESDSSSIHSFLSALEKRLTEEHGIKLDSSQSEDSKSTNAGPPSTMGTSGEKEMRKLQERRRKIDEKMQLMQSRLHSKSQGDKAKDEAALAKLREKLDKEAAKQEAKYQKELQKLDERRESEARKAERRRRKTAEKEEKSSLALELERTRAERDLALSHNRILEAQVGELQAQNTQLVAKLGRLGSTSSASLPLNTSGNSTEVAAEKQA